MSAPVTSFEVFEALGVECIQSFKTGLAQQGLLDSVLKSNLDYAMKAVEAMPISKRTNAVLQVEGEQTRIKIITGTPFFHHLVSNDNDGPELLQKIKVEGIQLTTKDIDESHFMGHCCRDEWNSCMKQAREAVDSIGEGLANVELKIRCGELQLTYTTAVPSTTIEIQPEWRGKITDSYLTDVFRVMHHMEKVGEMSPGMLACFKLVLSTSPNPYNFLLLSEGLKVDLVYDKPFGETESCVILFDGKKAQRYF